MSSFDVGDIEPVNFAPVDPSTTNDEVFHQQAPSCGTSDPRSPSLPPVSRVASRAGSSTKRIASTTSARSRNSSRGVGNPMLDGIRLRFIWYCMAEGLLMKTEFTEEEKIQYNALQDQSAREVMLIDNYPIGFELDEETRAWLTKSVVNYRTNGFLSQSQRRVVDEFYRMNPQYYNEYEKKVTEGFSDEQLLAYTMEKAGALIPDSPQAGSSTYLFTDDPDTPGKWDHPACLNAIYNGMCSANQPLSRYPDLLDDNVPWRVVVYYHYLSTLTLANQNFKYIRSYKDLGCEGKVTTNAKADESVYQDFEDNFHKDMAVPERAAFLGDMTSDWALKLRKALPFNKLNIQKTWEPDPKYNGSRSSLVLRTNSSRRRTAPSSRSAASSSSRRSKGKSAALPPDLPPPASPAIQTTSTFPSSSTTSTFPSSSTTSTFPSSSTTSTFPSSSTPFVGSASHPDTGSLSVDWPDSHIALPLPPPQTYGYDTGSLSVDWPDSHIALPLPPPQTYGYEGPNPSAPFPPAESDILDLEDINYDWSQPVDSSGNGGKPDIGGWDGQMFPTGHGQIHQNVGDLRRDFQDWVGDSNGYKPHSSEQDVLRNKSPQLLTLPPAILGLCRDLIR
ncbi:hypothetical protein CVT26_010516 [Gymnopilus dilepis]|uniref:Uncharacterized protein n=1 Tax=Gymnopilus dilepis TaxID=231916 RepID=A0A409Y0C5_9AGAR|nr:hypothetical protein CVT26_010516 [Gymnopilus dilepis]